MTTLADGWPPEASSDVVIEESLSFLQNYFSSNTAEPFKNLVYHKQLMSLVQRILLIEKCAIITPIDRTSALCLYFDGLSAMQSMLKDLDKAQEDSSMVAATLVYYLEVRIMQYS